MNFIKVYKNQFSNALCDDLIQLFEDCDSLGHTRTGDSGKRNVDVKLKDSIDLDMSPNRIPGLGTELFQRIEESICVPILNYLNTCVPSKDGELNYLDLDYTRRAFGFLQPPKLKRYRSPNEGYHAWHQDWGFLPAQVRRMLVVMAYLNDVEDGGETAFFHQDLKIKPEKGTVVIFPPYFTHMHKGLPPISNDKYICNCYIGVNENVIDEQFDKK